MLQSFKPTMVRKCPGSWNTVEENNNNKNQELKVYPNTKLMWNGKCSNNM